VFERAPTNLSMAYVLLAAVDILVLYVLYCYTVWYGPKIQEYSLPTANKLQILKADWYLLLRFQGFIIHS